MAVHHQHQGFSLRILHQECSIPVSALHCKDRYLVHLAINHIHQSTVHQVFVEMRKNLFSENHPDVAVSLNNVGSTLDGLGRHEEALTHKTKAREIYRKLFGEHHPFFALIVNNIGETLSALGHYEDACDLQKQALEIFRTLFSNPHPKVVISLNNLGQRLRELGGYQEAVK